MNWISVKDRLPEDEVKVWLHCINFVKSDVAHNDAISIKSPPGGRLGWYSGFLGEWKIEGSPSTGWNITHWQPLPPPPEG